MLITEKTKKEILCYLFGIIAFVVYFLPMYFFSSWNLSDIFLIPTIVFLSYDALRFIGRTGVFDLFAFQFANWLSSWRKGDPLKYKDAYEYKEQKRESREEKGWIWLPWLIYGMVCLFFCLLFAFLPPAV
ncbi:MAG: DUF3899 domain-containing protein [Eubacteriales bacterium]|nr:DUF3899 domain-containing protein [Eubacteriales bacterium]